MSAAINTYDVGDVIELKGVYTDPDSGNAVAPTTVRCLVKGPGTVSATLPVTGSAGTYTASYEPGAPGRYSYAFLGEGGHKAAGEREFSVRRPRVPRPA